MKKIITSIIFIFLITLSVNITKATVIPVGTTITGQYTYYDPEGDLEGQSLFQWYRDGVAISGATNITYTITSEDVGHTLIFEVTPVSLTGISPGEPIRSEGISITTAPAENTGGGGGGGGVVSSGGGVLPIINAATNTPVVISYTSASSSSATTTTTNMYLSLLDNKMYNCSPFKVNLKYNSKTNNVNDVKLLQAFLNKEVESKLPITGFYGKLTFNAVKSLQNKYSSDILKPLNLKTPTGFFYNATRIKANQLFGCELK